MTDLALVIEALWRAACDYWTYTPEQLSIAGANSFTVHDGHLWIGDGDGNLNGIPLEDLDLGFATTISPTVFPLT